MSQKKQTIQDLLNKGKIEEAKTLLWLFQNNPDF